MRNKTRRASVMLLQSQLVHDLLFHDVAWVCKNFCSLSVDIFKNFVFMSFAWPTQSATTAIDRYRWNIDHWCGNDHRNIRAVKTAIEDGSVRCLFFFLHLKSPFTTAVAILQSSVAWKEEERIDISYIIITVVFAWETSRCAAGIEELASNDLKFWVVDSRMSSWATITVLFCEVFRILCNLLVRDCFMFRDTSCGRHPSTCLSDFTLSCVFVYDGQIVLNGYRSLLHDGSVSSCLPNLTFLFQMLSAYD